MSCLNNKPAHTHKQLKSNKSFSLGMWVLHNRKQQQMSIDWNDAFNFQQSSIFVGLCARVTKAFSS